MPEPARTRPYIQRHIDAEITELLSGLGAVLIQGAKAVGKTATAQRHAARTVRLDRQAVADVVRADPAGAIRPPFPVFFDEWQRVPELLDEVRARVDEDPTPGLAILAGSAAPPKKAQPTHTGAGRIVTRRMRSLTLCERLDAAGLPATDRDTVSVTELLRGARPELRGASPWTLADYAREIVASGFPAIRPLTPRLRDAQLEGYIEHLVTRDVEEANGAAANPASVRRWLTACAAATATTTSLEKIRDLATAGDGSTPAKTTVLRYRDALERLFIADPIPAWHPGGTALSRLGEAPKMHLVDPGLSAHLLGVDEGALMDGVTTPLVEAVPTVRDGGLFGALFESLVAQSMRTYAQTVGAAHHYVRTRGGDHEVDGVLVRRDHRILAYEVKLAGAVNDDDVRHLRWLRNHLGDQLVDAIVIHTGPEAYRRRQDGIGIVPAALLVP
jgi:predicted AAA+ superfamily ATPase